MSPRAIDWTAQMESLGRCAVAIGVFDGVHRGHQALLEDTVRDARRRSARSVVLTFDRDPDQVVTPESAAPQLLALDDKIDAILALGISRVLVVPFTTEVAVMGPETFLDRVVSSSCQPVSIHVGKDFRFGHRAAGDLDTLYVWGVEHNVEVIGHDLLMVQGHPVSSTRIRGLIAVGDIARATALLGYAPRVAGTVVHGRGEGGALGFATANVEPDAFAALPASGVYAGVAQLADHSRWATAISVGTPPTFSQARDVLEAHVIDFEGDLYEQRVTLDFYQRLRDQRKFGSVDALKLQIASDVATTVELVGENRALDCCTVVPAGGPAATDDSAGWDGEAVVEDPEALEAAERAVANVDATELYSQFDDSWVDVLGPVSLANVTGSLTAFGLTSPLNAAGIPYVWSPFSPEALSGVRPELMTTRRFRLFVPPEFEEAACRALSDTRSGED